MTDSLPKDLCPVCGEGWALIGVHLAWAHDIETMEQLRMALSNAGYSGVDDD